MKMVYKKPVPIFTFLLLFLLESCCCVSYSNHLWLGRKPPSAGPLQESNLRASVNKKLTGVARGAGFVTTPFKRFGILGWRDMKTDAVALAEVVQAAASTDGFVTVDLRLENITLGGQPIPLKSTRFIRAEICVEALGLSRSERPCTGDKVRLSGRLLWDGDGFLEIHPQRRTDIEILSKTTSACRWRFPVPTPPNHQKGTAASRPCRPPVVRRPPPPSLSAQHRPLWPAPAHPREAPVRPQVVPPCQGPSACRL